MYISHKLLPVAARSKARLLGLWVRIPPGAWMSVCVECCQVEVSATGWSLVQREVLPTVMCRCVWSRNVKNEEAMTRVGSQRHKKVYILLRIFEPFCTVPASPDFCLCKQSSLRKRPVLFTSAELIFLTYEKHCTALPYHSYKVCLIRLLNN